MRNKVYTIVKYFKLYNSIGVKVCCHVTIPFKETIEQQRKPLLMWKEKHKSANIIVLRSEKYPMHRKQKAEE